MPNSCVACGVILPESERTDTCSYDCFEAAHCHFPVPLEFEPIVLDELLVHA